MRLLALQSAQHHFVLFILFLLSITFIIMHRATTFFWLRFISILVIKWPSTQWLQQRWRKSKPKEDWTCTVPQLGYAVVVIEAKKFSLPPLNQQRHMQCSSSVWYCTWLVITYIRTVCCILRWHNQLDPNESWLQICCTDPCYMRHSTCKSILTL